MKSNSFRISSGVVVQVSKWGNSLAVRLAEGDVVDILRAGERSVEIVKRDDQGAFLKKLRALQKPTPKGFRWNRAEANEW
jgi:antitoxin MazE